MIILEQLVIASDKASSQYFCLILESLSTALFLIMRLRQVVRGGSNSTDI